MSGFFSLLQIFAYACLGIVIIGAVAAGTVWVRRQMLTPGDLAEDNLKVAKAETEISELNVQREFHGLIRDKLIDARLDGDITKAIGPGATLEVGPDGFQIKGKTMSSTGSHRPFPSHKTTRRPRLPWEY